MPTWPNSLPPFPEADAFQEQDVSQVLRSEMDTGPAKVRRRFTGRVSNFPVRWTLDGVQVSALETFFYDTLGGGSLTFTAKHPRTGANVTLRFLEPYTVTPSSHQLLWNVSGKVECLHGIIPT